MPGIKIAGDCSTRKIFTKTDNDFLLPAWLEERRVGDAALGCAYDAVPPAYRAALKTGLALAHFHFGDASFRERREINNEHLGFGQCSQISPRPWAAICIPENLAAPALLASAVALPLLAGVENALAIFAGDKPDEADLLALELCAMENVFCVAPPELPGLLNDLARLGEGAIFAFGTEIGAVARASAMPCHEAPARPKLLLANPEHFDADMLCFLYGVEAETVVTSDTAWDCVFAQDNQLPRGVAARLLLRPGCEGFWLHSNISPDFFKNKTVSFQAIA